jgi:hypothetical protein
MKIKQESSILLADSSFEFDFFWGFTQKVKIESNNKEFSLTGKIPKGKSIHYVEVEWSEIWKYTDNEEEEPYFIKQFQTLKPAYSLAFELSCGITNHSKISNINYGEDARDYEGIDRVVRIYGIKVDIYIVND